MNRVHEPQADLYLANLKEVTGVVDARVGLDKKTKLQKLYLRIRGGKTATYQLEYYERPPTPALVRLRGAPGDRARKFVFTPRVTRGVAEAMIEAGLDYIDLQARLTGADGAVREDVYFDRHRLRPHLFAEIFKGL